MTIKQTICDYVSKAVASVAVIGMLAGAVDSLYRLYDGPIVTGPLLFKLDEPILDSLEGIEYKGERIFAPQVGRYREEVLGGN